MKHKLIRNRDRVQTPPTFLPDLYHDFRRDLIENLIECANYKSLYLRSVFETKLVDGTESVDPDTRRRLAIEKWLKTEERNLVTNIRLTHSEGNDPVSVIGDEVITFGKIRHEAVRYIVQTIGREVNFDDLSGSFSGGASTSIRRGVGTVARKYQDGTDITSSAVLPYMQLARMAWPLPHDLVEVEGNVMFTVEKTSAIDRVACKEPELNMFCQKAVGDFFRRRLQSKGIDLNDQKVNQSMAREGSLDGFLATIDLSSASDSLTTSAVWQLMPYDWSLLLMDLRSPITMIDGVAHKNEMISSMGNGFTFELESLIFWALVRATCAATGTRGAIGVYGDDLIMPSSTVGHLINVLDYFGFVVNEDKSFWDGSFRESCGKHWFHGMDVTPFYVKKVPKTVPDWCNLLNSLRRWAVEFDGICDPRFYDLWTKYAKHIPTSLHGSRDVNRSDALVNPTKRNIRVCRPKVVRSRITESRYQGGAYSHWLSTYGTRSSVIPLSDKPISLFSANAELRMVKVTRKSDTPDTLHTPTFPQELGVNNL